MKHYFKNLGEKRKFFITKDGLDSLKKRLDELTLNRLYTIRRLRTIDKKTNWTTRVLLMTYLILSNLNKRYLN